MSVAVLHSTSTEGRTALVEAVREARTRSTDLVVLHAFSGSQAAEESEAAAVENAVIAAFSEIESAGDVVWSVATGQPDPDSTSTLLALIDKADAELVVVGSRHRSAVGKFLMGQPIQRLLLESRIPVLLVKS
jgi:nucleotide-binding universal stress UspA family protein